MAFVPLAAIRHRRILTGLSELYGVHSLDSSSTADVRAVSSFLHTLVTDDC